LNISLELLSLGNNEKIAQGKMLGRKKIPTKF